MKLPALLLLSATCLWGLSPTAHAQKDTSASLFHKRCAMCHGADGTGHTPAGKAFKAVDYHDPEVLKMSDAELAAIIRTGKEKMPAFGSKLSASDIDSLVAYIHTLQKK